MSAGRAPCGWKIRASEAERAEWHAKARSAGLTLSDLVREHTRKLARIGNNLNQIRPLDEHPQDCGRGRHRHVDSSVILMVPTHSVRDASFFHYQG